MVNRRRKRQYMGRVLICLGLVLRIIQLIGGAQLGADALLGTWITAATASFLVGGLCVFALERLNITSVISLVCAATILLSMFFADTGGEGVLIFIFSFVSFALMLISMKRYYRVVAGAVLLVLTLVITLCSAGILDFSAVSVTALLTISYLVEGIGLFV